VCIRFFGICSRHSRSMDTLHPVAHDDEQPRPIALCELSERSHDPCVKPLLVGLSQAHNQHAIVLLVAVLRNPCPW
jgi:hypothetical protein